MRKYIFVYLLLLLGNHIYAQAPDPQTYAIVIGVSKYVNNNISPLKFPDDDARAFARLLTTAACGKVPQKNITLLVDSQATRLNILAGIKQVLKNVSAEDMLIFYFSGHGAPDEDTRQGYFYSYDADPANLDITAISMEETRDKISGSNAKLKVSYIDACHAGLFMSRRTKSESVSKELVEKYTSVLRNADNGTVVFMSSNGREKSIEDDKYPNSIFTHFLLQGLSGKADWVNRNAKGYHDGIVSAAELAEYLKRVDTASGNSQHASGIGDVDDDFPLSVANPNMSIGKVITATKTQTRAAKEMVVEDNSDEENVPAANNTTTVKKINERNISVPESRTVRQPVQKQDQGLDATGTLRILSREDKSELNKIDVKVSPNVRVYINFDAESKQFAKQIQNYLSNRRFKVTGPYRWKEEVNTDRRFFIRVAEHGKDYEVVVGVKQ
jgi:hypothetical protein